MKKKASKPVEIAPNLQPKPTVKKPGELKKTLRITPDEQKLITELQAHGRHTTESAAILHAIKYFVIRDAAIERLTVQLQSEREHLRKMRSNAAVFIKALDEIRINGVF